MHRASISPHPHQHPSFSGRSYEHFGQTFSAATLDIIMATKLGYSLKIRWLIHDRTCFHTYFSCCLEKSLQMPAQLVLWEVSSLSRSSCHPSLGIRLTLSHIILSECICFLQTRNSLIAVPERDLLSVFRALERSWDIPGTYKPSSTEWTMVLIVNVGPGGALQWGSPRSALWSCAPCYMLGIL